MSIAIRFALAGLVAAALCPGAEVEVVLTDHARVNPVELVPARQEASRLLAAAGIVLRRSTPEPDLGHPARAVVLNILPAENGPAMASWRRSLWICTCRLDGRSVLPLRGPVDGGG